MRALVLGTAGHIDHGKSALVKALTGTDPDRLKEEQARGITIDLGFAHAAIGDVSVAFVDVPGHERFVRNMLAGAGGVDAVLFVVAADESVMPQTREHLAICRLLGIERGVIALTKSDLVDAETARLANIDVRDLVAGSFLADAPIVSVSARTGAGLDQLRDAIAALARHSGTRSARAGIVRLPIDRAFTVKGFGTVVTGTLVSGAIALGDMLEALPEHRAIRVRGLNVHGRRVDRIDAPSRAAVNIGAIDLAAVPRGVTIVSPGALSVTRHVDARIEVLPDAPALRHGASVRVHQGTSVVTGVVSIGALHPRDAAAWTPVAMGTAAVSVPAGGEGYVRLRLHDAVAVTRLDRVILRGIASGATIGGGTILDPEPPIGGLRRRGSLERFQELDAGGLDEAVARWLREDAGCVLTVSDLVHRGGADAEGAARTLQRLVQAGRAVAASDGIVDAGALAECERRAREALGAFHRARPEDAGMPRESLRMQLASRDSETLLTLAIDRLLASGEIGGTDKLALAGHRPAKSAADARTRDAIARALAEAGLTPPDADGLASAVGQTRDAFDRALRALIAEGVIVKAGPLLLHRDAIGRLVGDVRALKSGPPAVAGHTGGATIDVGWFKTRFGLSRKFAIPLLEHLDRTRVTRRVGDTRVVL
jgi:selenocysteine-specific elongation factor